MCEEKIIDTRGVLTITRVTADGSNYIEVKVVDARSYKRVITVCVPSEDFASALTGLGAQDCGVEYLLSDRIGKRREVRQIPIEIPPDPDWFPYSKVMNAIQEHEGDGWIAYPPKDIMNARHHYRNEESGKKFMRVTYRRYVDVD